MLLCSEGDWLYAIDLRGMMKGPAVGMGKLPSLIIL